MRLTSKTSLHVSTSFHIFGTLLHFVTSQTPQIFLFVNAEKALFILDSFFFNSLISHDPILQALSRVALRPLPCIYHQFDCDPGNILHVLLVKRWCLAVRFLLPSPDQRPLQPVFQVPCRRSRDPGHNYKNKIIIEDRLRLCIDTELPRDVTKMEMRVRRTHAQLLCAWNETKLGAGAGGRDMHFCLLN